jgi:photosystem II stability/assembly factor-like uncharacterized protein
MKKFISKVSILILLFSFVQISYSQQWVHLFNDPQANFYDIQREFNKYWEGRTPERGQGWMVFKRWEYFMEPRVYPSGNLPDPAATYIEIQKYKQTHRDNINDLSNWISLGPSSWLSISYNPGIGRINCITAHPTNSNILFAGAPSGGLWKSINGGQNWSTATDNLEVLGVSGIIINPVNPDIMYIATGDGDGGATYSIGVLKSTNGGGSWMTTGLSYQVSQGLRINKLVSNPANSNILIAGSNFGIYRSTDGAATWTQVISNSIRDIEFHPSNSNIIYAAGTLFYKSTNGGVTFNPSGSGLPSSGVNRLAIGVSPAGANYVYILASSSANSGFYGFYRSTNSGDNFVMTIDSPNILGYNANGSSVGGQGTYDLCVAVSPNNVNEVYTGGINIWKSTNAGSSFVCNTYWIYPPSSYGYVHADIHTIDFIGTTMYTGTDGGLFKSANFGSNWIDLSAGMSTTQFYRFGGTPQNANYLIGGTQDNGTNLYTGVWTHVLGADGMEAAVDPVNQNTVYACIQNGGLRRSFNGGNSFSSMVSNITGSGAWVTPYVLDPVDPQTIYTGFQDVWRSSNQGSSWSKLTEYNGTTFRSLAVAKSNNNYIYAGTYTAIYRSSDKGNNWTEITAGLPGNSKTYIDVNSTDPNKLWVTLSGYTAGQKIYYSSNAGNTWVNISGTLPNLPANCVSYLHPDRLFIGMDVGVYYRDNTMNDWAPFMTNLPNVEVSEFEFYLPSNKIRAATYGRGIWESVIPPVTGNNSGNDNIPVSFALFQNYPNPFNPQTVIRFDIPVKSNVSLKIFNILGQEVKTLVYSELSPGEKSVSWNGKDNAGLSVNSGIYVYELRAGDYRESKKLVFVK